jgi:hypothetical protein
MVRRQLTDFSVQKNAIVSLIKFKQQNGLFVKAFHDLYNKNKKPSKLVLIIDDIKDIIESIEIKLRQTEIIFYTYFDSEYDSRIIVNNSLISNKIIETEFEYCTKIINNRIEINDPVFYKEIIDMNFQIYILTIASLYENIVRLLDTLLKKIVVYGGDDIPHKSVPLNLIISYWKNIVELEYRENDDFYNWLLTHCNSYLDKYLSQINSLRNRFIHGYTLNLTIDINHHEYMVRNHDDQFGFKPIQNNAFIPELILNNFVKVILENTQLLTKELLDLFQTELSKPSTRIPI